MAWEHSQLVQLVLQHMCIWLGNVSHEHLVLELRVGLGMCPRRVWVAASCASGLGTLPASIWRFEVCVRLGNVSHSSWCAPACKQSVCLRTGLLPSTGDIFIPRYAATLCEFAHQAVCPWTWLLPPTDDNLSFGPLRRALGLRIRPSGYGRGSSHLRATVTRSALQGARLSPLVGATATAEMRRCGPQSSQDDTGLHRHTL